MPTSPNSRTTQTAPNQPLEHRGRRRPHRPNALRTHDRFASEPLRTHKTAKQLPLMHKTHSPQARVGYSASSRDNAAPGGIRNRRSASTCPVRVGELSAAALANPRHDFVLHAPCSWAIPRRNLWHVSGEAPPVCVVAAALMARPGRTPVRVGCRLVAPHRVRDFLRAMASVTLVAQRVALAEGACVTHAIFDDHLVALFAHFAPTDMLASLDDLACGDLDLRAALWAAPAAVWRHAADHCNTWLAEARSALLATAAWHRDEHRRVEAYCAVHGLVVHGHR
mmetsp:Transcript_32418/g.64637  ORF Transcript_32418/g.64637 Transcript_32418/m.64637 type:complete len:281 (+) Transcript_32418:176-1018(+)